MKRQILVMFLSLFICAGLFAGQQGSGGPSDSAALTIGVYGDLESAFKAVFNSEDFKTKFPGLDIEIQPADFGGHHNRLVTQINAGTGANDIEALDIGYIARFAADNGFTDLAKSSYNGVEAGKNLARFSMSNATTTRGKLIAMPVDIAPALMYYRKSFCDDAGLNMDNIVSWDEYIEKGIKLTVDTDGDGRIDRYALTHPFDLAMIPLNGGKGDWFKKGVPYEPKERFIKVLDVVQSVRQAGIDANFTPWSGEWINGFKEDKVITMFTGSWFGGHFKSWMCPELMGDWRIAYPPGRTYSSYGGSYLGIPAQTAQSKKQAAFEIIKYLATSPEAQLLMFRTTDAFPALTTVYNDPVMDEPVEFYGGQKVRQIFRDIGTYIPEQYVSEYDAIALDAFNRAIDAVISGGIPVEEAYEEARKEVRERM